MTVISCFILKIFGALKAQERKTSYLCVYTDNAISPKRCNHPHKRMLIGKQVALQVARNSHANKVTISK